MAIHPRPYGSDIQIIRSDGTLRIIPVYRGSKRRAFHLILSYRRANLLTDGEATMALCGLNTITEPSDDRDESDDDWKDWTDHGEPVGAVRAFVRRVIDAVVWMIARDEEPECAGR